MTKALGYGWNTEKCYCGNKKELNQLVCNKCHETSKKEKKEK